MSNPSTTTLSPSWRAAVQAHWRPLCLLIGYLLLAFSYSILNPIHEGTDELRHYRFVRYIVENKHLPIQGQEQCRSQSHHPPLIYALGALVSGWVETGRDVCANPVENPFWGYHAWEVGTDNKNLYIHTPAEAFPWQGEALAARLVRFLNVLVGLGAVLFTYATARTMWPKRPWMATGAAAFIAFNPMFLYMSGTINNDVIAALSGAAVMYTCVRLLFFSEQASAQTLSWRWGIYLGLAYALALMSKFNLAPIIALIELVLLLIAYTHKAWPWWFKTNIALGIVTLLGAGWWFVRNYYLYGDPTGFETVTELWGVRNPSESFWLVMQELPQAWSSLWGRFGYGQIPLPGWIYGALWVAFLSAAVGLLLPIVLQWPVPRPERRSIGILFLQVFIFFAVLFAYMLVSPAGAMGRFFFPGLPALAILLFYGLGQWALALKNRFSTPIPLEGLTYVTTGAMLLLALVALFGYLAPAYAAPPGWDEADLAAVSHQTEVKFASLVKLRGYDINTEMVTVGGELQIKLYWEVLDQPPGDYWFFVHLIDDAGTMVAQRDSHPALGKFPASQWRPGDRFVDTISLSIPEIAYPAQARLQIGLYAPGSYRLPVITADGTQLGDAFNLAAVTITPTADGLLPNHTDLNFGPYVRLLDYTYSGRELVIGDTLTITLQWEMLQRDLDGQVSQVVVTSADGSWRKRSDNGLQKRRPSNDEQNIIIDEHTIHIDANAPPGSYEISVLLIDFFTQKSANIVAEDGHWIDNELPLASVTVTIPTVTDSP